MSLDVRLRPPRPSDEDQVRAAQSIMAVEGFEFALGLEPEMPWAEWLRIADQERSGADLPEGRVPASFLIAEVDGRVVGRVSIRHALNDKLAVKGGHIGYGVVPTMRRRGIATEILRQSLIIARSVGVDRALVTCDDDNVGSIKVIEACGGQLDVERPLVAGERATRRYWIE